MARADPRGVVGSRRRDRWAVPWTYSEQSFLPHAQLGDGDASRQPVLITVEDGAAMPTMRMCCSLVGGAMPPAWDSATSRTSLARIVLIFDGRDPAALAAARAAWKDAKAAGHDVTYWKEQPSGKFEKQA